MTLVLTDSGLGGLSVFAHLARELKVIFSADSGLGKKLIYVNAVPRDGYGYNDMSSRKERIRIFNGILEIIHQRFKPKRIFVACGSLSALLNEIPYTHSHPEMVDGIDIIGRMLLKSAMSQQPKATVFVFASPTTISEGIYTRYLSNSGYFKQKIIKQSCPGLATMISSDLDKLMVQNAVNGFCREALAKWNNAHPESAQIVPIVFLGCTHYSFRKECFVDAFAEIGFPEIQLLDPNPVAAEMLLQDTNPIESDKGLELEFLTPYPLPNQEIHTINTFLEKICLNTSKAFRQPYVIPELIS